MTSLTDSAERSGSETLSASGTRSLLDALLEAMVSMDAGDDALKRRFGEIVDASEDAIISGSLDGTIETWNPGAERLYGYGANEMIGTSVGRLRPHGNLDDVATQRRELLDGRPVSMETRERRIDGRLVDVALTMSPLRDHLGSVTGVTVVARDITERNRAAARLAEEHSRFAGAFRAAAMGMALVSVEGRFIEVNDALCELLQRDAEALGAMTFQDVTHPDDLESDLEQLDRTLAGETDCYQLTKRYLLPNGGIVWGLLTVTLVRDADGQPLQFVSQIQDVTDRKTAEGELRRCAAQLEALSDRDPLTGLCNRRAFETALAGELDGLAAGEGECSVLLAVVDGDDSAVAGAAVALRDVSRGNDLIAHLGSGELAVLLSGVGTDAAEPVARRAAGALGERARCVHATARCDDGPGDLLGRARHKAAEQAGGSPRTRPRAVPASVDRLLELVRRQLCMPVAYLTRHEDGLSVLARVVGESASLVEGEAMPAAETYCRWMLASTVADLAADPRTRDLGATTEHGLRAYAGVPVRLRSGELYGTLCAVDVQPHGDLGERHAELLSFASELVAELLDHEAEDGAARRAEAGAVGVRTLLGALQARDFYTAEHSQQVVALATAVAGRLGLSADDQRTVGQVALLHDLGKVGIPDAVLQKQGPLDEQEWQLMRLHPVVGERIIAGTSGLTHLAPAIRAEHERWDGRGYPDQLAGEEIPIASRITLACDALHAMTSHRPYRPAHTLEHARRELESCAGAQFDARVVEALLAVLEADVTPVAL